MFVGQGVVEGCRIVIYICITLPFEKHSIPWQVGIAELAISEKPFCGGTIIGPRTILSGTYLLRLLKIRLALITLLMLDTLHLTRGQNFLQTCKTILTFLFEIDCGYWFAP